MFFASLGQCSRGHHHQPIHVRHMRFRVCDPPDPRALFFARGAISTVLALCRTGPVTVLYTERKTRIAKTEIFVSPSNLGILAGRRHALRQPPPGLARRRRVIRSRSRRFLPFFVIGERDIQYLILITSLTTPTYPAVAVWWSWTLGPSLRARWHATS
jgi:hypothetical protein